MLDRLSADMEARLAPKSPWVIDKMSDDALAKMMRMILPIEVEVTGLDGTWKLGQNKTEAARLGAVDGLADSGFGAEVAALATAMKDPPF